MASHSPGPRPSTIDENPSTGCDGVGNVMPFVAPVKKLPDVGPGAYVLTSSTARPTRRGLTAAVAVVAPAMMPGTSANAATTPAVRTSLVDLVDMADSLSSSFLV